MVLKVLKDEAGNVIHACAVGSFPLPAGHWIYGEPVQPSAIDGDLPPDIRLKLRDALRYTLQVCTSRGKDDFDPDAVCMTFLNTLLGLEFRNDCEVQGNAAEERFAMLDWKERVAKWAEDRNLVQGSNPVLQMNKLLEEVQELSNALIANDTNEICDAIGDIQVVLAVMCAQLGQDIDQCREIAWEQIKDRKGKMVNGVFEKEVQGE